MSTSDLQSVLPGSARASGSQPAQLAEMVAHGLKRAGTRVVYGMPGGGNNLEVVEACEAAGLRFVLTHGETAAAIMASVEGEFSGIPGACVVTRGPGAASAVNGIAQAMLDRVPLALITDAVSWGDRPRVPHQRLDQQAMFSPVTKWSGVIGADGGDEVIGAALALAGKPLPGPVHLEFVPDAPRTPGPSANEASDDVSERMSADVRNMLVASRCPVFVVGVGARRAIAALRELLEDKPWPVLTTYKAKGAIPESWANAAGLLTGAKIEAPVLEAADLIVAVGFDPVELIPASWPYRAPILSLTEAPTPSHYFTPACELVGPLADLLALAAEALPTRFDGPAFGRDTRAAAEADLIELPADGIGPQHVVLAARASAPPGTTATVDAGAHMLVTMPLWEVEAPDEVLISSGLATMGYSLPAAIGAAVARPDRHVICFTGDGGLGMTLAELETVSRLSLPVVVTVFNDSALSLIEIKQKPGGHGGTGAVRYGPMDFAAIGKAVGIRSRRVGSPSELAVAFAEALEERRPFLIDAVVDPRAYPQIMKIIRG